MKTETGIYFILHRPTNMVYIGSSSNISARRRSFFTPTVRTWAYPFLQWLTWKDRSEFYFGIYEYYPENIPASVLKYYEHKVIRLVDEERRLNSAIHYGNLKASKIKCPKVRRLARQDAKELENCFA